MVGELCISWVQAAQSVLIALFQLNTPEFTMLLGALPKTFQDGATKLLQNHLRNAGGVAPVRYASSHARILVYNSEIIEGKIF